MSAYGYLPFCLRSIFKIQEKHGFNFVAQQHIKDLADKLSHTLSLVARKPTCVRAFMCIYGGGVTAQLARERDNYQGSDFPQASCYNE